MVYICSIKICRNITGKNTFKAHKFPASQEIANRWLCVIKKIQPSYERTKTAIICSAHFINSDYIMSDNTKLLKKDSIPSIFHTTAGKSLRRVYEDLPIDVPTSSTTATTNDDSVSYETDKMREFIVVTENSGYYTCLGDFDHNEDRDVCHRKRDLELPSWRIKSITMDAADISNETIPQMEYNTKCETNAQMRYYSKCEKYEQKIKRWDVQRARELKQIEYLKEGRYKNSTQTLGNANTEKDMTSLLPNPEGIDMVRVNSNVPVSAFGCNLHIKKKAGLYKFHYSKWCNDGTELPE